MSVLFPRFRGRFGNQCLIYLFARGYAERHGMTLKTGDWIGRRVFQLSDDAIDIGAREVETFDEANEYGMSDFAQCEKRPNIFFSGYGQMQLCADYYTKRQAQGWLKLRPEIEAVCAKSLGPMPIVCHERRGDYFGYRYPVVSRASYINAMAEYGLAGPPAAFLSEEHPTPPEPGELPNELGFMPDFYRMMRAPTLLRANSTFSWLAALLGNGLVLSPVIDGLEGGKEHDNVKFVAGNHPRLANFEFTTDMWVAP